MELCTIENYILNSDSIYLEESKKEYLIDTYQRGIEKKESICFKIYQNATILPVVLLQKDGRTYGKVGVLKDNGDYIKESSVDNLYRGAYIPETFRTSDKTVAYLGCDHNAWGHFIVNVIPRVWIALEHDCEIDEYVIVRDMESDNITLCNNQLRFFSYLGILDKIRILTIPTKYSKVIVPEASYYPRKYIEEETNQGYFFDEFTRVFDIVSERALQNYSMHLHKNVESQYPKIFFSRIPGLSRNQTDIGVELINSFFINNGYTIIYPEKISLDEMIYYLHHCESIAYLSGTLQHNMLFAPQGMKTIAVERRIILSINQTDIDLIKKIKPIYVSAQYTILPGNRALSSVYAYSSFLKEFIRKNNLNLPDLQYTQKMYLKKCIIEYLSNLKWTYAWQDTQPSPYNSFYFKVLENNFKEVEEIIPEIGSIKKENIKDPIYWKGKFQELLMLNNIPYSCWDENNFRKFVKTICSLIEENLEKECDFFLLYPYGVNGLIIEKVLKQRYKINSYAIFDNRLSDYNMDVMKLKQIPDYLSENVCVILTSCNVECRRELEKYCERDRIVGPYTVF